MLFFHTTSLTSQKSAHSLFQAIEMMTWPSTPTQPFGGSALQWRLRSSAADLYVVWQRTALLTSQANTALLLKYKHLKPALGTESRAKADCCHRIIKQHVEVCYSNWAAKNPGGQGSLFIDCSSDQKLDGTAGS